MILTLFAGSMAVQAANRFYINTKKATVNIGDEDNKLVLEIRNLSQSDKKPSWTSWNENIAKVEQQGDKGVVTAISKGKTVISSGVGFPRETCVVTVVEPEIKLNKTSAVLYHGGSTVSIQLKASVKGADKKVVWKSADTEVATVNDQGVVTAKRAGKTVITAVANGQSSSCEVKVLDSELTLNVDAVRLSTKGAGSSVRLVPKIIGATKKVVWSSSDKSIARVKNGKITGKKTGTATITAVANGVEAKCAVTVVDGLVSVSEEYAQLYITGGKAETKQLKTNASKNETIVWRSSDETVASVDSNGLVRAKKAGTAVITAECKGKSDACVIEVANTAISLPERTVYLTTAGAAKTYTVDYQVIGRKKNVKWKSSDTKTASVKKGKITAKREGRTTISVEANGIKETINVIVQKDMPSVTFKQNEYTLYTKGAGNTVDLKPSVSEKIQNIVWQSSNREIAEVSDKGKVTAKKEGTARIKAKVNNVTAECIIRVKETKVTLDEEHLLLKKGDKKSLGAEITGASQSVKYSTSNAKVATVKKGVITAKNYGEADIRVTANGVASICHVVVSNCNTHDWQRAEQYDREPTCTESGLVTYICTKCNGKKQEIVAPLGHDFGEWKVDISATESTAGREKQVCSRCGTENIREIPKLPPKEPNQPEPDKPDLPVNPAYQLVWEDNFDGEKLNLDDWNFEYHEPGWVNAELQAYVDSEKNTYVKDGMLYIQAIKEIIDGKPYYTSGRINTQKKHDFQYGRFEVRAKVPSGKGFLPAFWMMPTDESFYGQWPKCGEIDIMEVHGSALDTSYGTLHFGEPHTQKQGSYTLPDGQENFGEAFHVFACEWDPGEFRFYVDDHLFYTVNDWFTKKPGFGEVAYPAPYDQPFYLILNLAVGGSWVGYPDEDAVFGDNAQFVIDYVRAYQKDSYDTDVDKPENDVKLRDPDETGNYVINGDFSVVEDLSQEDSNWKLLLAGAGEAEASIADNMLHVTTTEAGELNYSVQVVQADLPMGKGIKYELSYDAYADEARTMITGISAPDKGYIRYLNDTTVELTTDKQTYRHVFDMTADSDANGRVEFNLGNQGSTAAVHISNVRLEKTGEAEEEVKGMLPDGNYVYNGQFNEGNEAGKRRLAYWDWDIEQCSGTGISVTSDSRRELQVSVPDSVAALDQVVVYQKPIAIGGGKKFIFSFDAYADREKTVKAEVAGNAYDVALTTERQTFKYEFETPADLDGSTLRYLLGAAGTTYIDNVTVREDSLLVNGDFSSGLLGYEVYVNDAAKVPNYIVDSLNEKNALAIDIADTGTEGWQIQLKQNDVRLEKDKWYKLAFDAKSTKDRVIMYALQRDGSKHKNENGSEDWTPYSGEPKAELTGEWQNFSKVFRMAQDTDPNTILSISLGAVGGTRITDKHTVLIDNITLEETDPIEEPPVEQGENLIQNGDFAAGEEHWKSEVTAPGEAAASFEDGKAVYEITNVGTEDWHVQLKQSGLKLEKGASYQVRMNIKSTESRIVKYAFLDPSYDWYGGEDLNLTANEVKAVEYKLDVTKPTHNEITFVISMGKIANEDTPASTIEIDDISVIKTSSGTTTPEPEPEEPDPNEMIVNGNFASGETHWVKEVGSLAEANFTDGKAVFNISDVGSNDWDIKLRYEDHLKLEQGATYKVKMKIKSTAARTVKYSFMTSEYKWYGGEDLALAADELKEVSYDMTVGQDGDGNDLGTSEDITFSISMGKIANEDTPASTIEIDDISVIKTSSGTTTPEPEPEEPDPNEMIVNGNFASGETHWVKEVGSLAEANFTDGKAVFNISDVGSNDWDIKLRYEDHLKLEQGATYKVKMKIKSTAARTVKYSFMTSEYKWYGGEDLALAADELKEVSYDMTVGQDGDGNDLGTSEDITFSISMGKIANEDTPASTIEIDDISVIKTSEPESTADDSKNVESETEEQHTTEQESEEVKSTENTESEEAESEEERTTEAEDSKESESDKATETESEETNSDVFEETQESESVRTEETEETENTETSDLEETETVETESIETIKTELTENETIEEENNIIH